MLATVSAGRRGDAEIGIINLDVGRNQHIPRKLGFGSSQKEDMQQLPGKGDRHSAGIVERDTMKTKSGTLIFPP